MLFHVLFYCFIWLLLIPWSRVLLPTSEIKKFLQLVVFVNLDNRWRDATAPLRLCCEKTKTDK